MEGLRQYDAATKSMTESGNAPCRFADYLREGRDCGAKCGTVTAVSGTAVVCAYIGDQSGIPHGRPLGILVGAVLGYLGTTYFAEGIPPCLSSKFPCVARYHQWKVLKSEGGVTSVFRIRANQDSVLRAYCDPITGELPLNPREAPDGEIYDDATLERLMVRGVVKARSGGDYPLCTFNRTELVESTKTEVAILVRMMRLIDDDIQSYRINSVTRSALVRYKTIIKSQLKEAIGRQRSWIKKEYALRETDNLPLAKKLEKTRDAEDDDLYRILDRGTDSPISHKTLRLRPRPV